jgi:predicted dehydrogenase
VGRQGLMANLRTLIGFDDLQIAAVCETDQWRMDNARGEVEKHYGAKAASGKYAGCATFRDFRELLARKDIDAVMVSTPDHWHAPMGVAAARAGKDVLMEKPITLTISEGRIMADTMKMYGRIFRVDSEFRSNRFFHQAAELALNGRIGKIHTIRTGTPRETPGGDAKPMPVPEGLDYAMWLGPAPDAPYTLDRVHPVKEYGRPGWMKLRDYCDGMICNWGTHLNDISQWGNGTERTGPVEVEGKGTYPSDGFYNVLIDFQVTYRFANGVTQHYTMSRPFVRFEGDGGWIEAEMGKITAEPADILKARPGANEIRLPLKSEKRDFVDCVKSRAQPIADAEVGHRTTSLCHLGHIAVQLGRKLKWDPVAEKFPEDAEANRLLGRFLKAPWRL